ncbi:MULTISPECIES: hypothetical protein [unclassified Moraxella]|uniref:hypothetical protein n=1 Tax=unclassified Moraxella TaxID=2685852 RepID=UPI003AF44301
MQTDKDYEMYKDLDLDNTVGIKRIKHPLIAQLQNTAKAETTPIDSDILSWLTKQDTQTKQYINNMIRNFMNFKTA